MIRKFRGISKKDNNFYYGDLVRNMCFDENGYHDFENTICFDNDYCGEIYPESIGQFTGMKDKNGLEIYEGDILESNCQLLTNWGKTPTGKYNKSTSCVIYEDGYWKQKQLTNDRWSEKWNNKGKCSEIVWSVFSKFNQVIGNIHQNPELLEEEK